MNVNLQEYVDTIDDLAKEKIGVEYASDAFSECKTLEDFQDKMKEINNRVCNFMNTK